MFVRFIDQKSAHKMEKMLCEYGIWMRKLRFYLVQHNRKTIRSEEMMGCVNRLDLQEARSLPLPKTMANLVKWCWVVDAVCRKLQEWERDHGKEPCYTLLLREYYGMHMEAYEQDEWVYQGTKPRRLVTMERGHMEQTTFYEVRRQILAAVYTAAVQIGIYQPYPVEEEEQQAM